MLKSVAEFYRGRSVLVTGGTGFLGKVLLEKLLYSCPDLDKLYILIRENKNATAQQRVEKMLEQPVFTRLRNENQQMFNKIIPIAGDVAAPNLGIKSEDEQLLTDNVSTVFHMAATIKFNESLEKAMNVNVGGTERIMSLSQRMINIKSFVYVSTTYSNTDEQIIEEIVYPPPATLHQVKKLIERGISENQVKKLLGERPNTYTFTKAMAENLVADNHGTIPSVIIRPSIVTSSQTEPIPGWIDSWTGATTLMSSVCKGINRVALAHPDNKFDLIPVDYVTNLMIVAASKCESSKDLVVYNSSSSGENPIKIDYFLKRAIEESKKQKFYDIPMPTVLFTQSKLVIRLVTFALQTVPALIADTFLFISRRETKYMKMQARLHLFRGAVDFFTSNSWVIPAKNTRALAGSLSSSDRRKFPCDPADIDWNDYVPSYLRGVKRFMYKS